MNFNPDPKEKVIRLEGKAKTEFKKAVYDRDGGICQGCHRWFPLLDQDGQFDVFTCIHLSHIKSYGAGGGDTMSNAEILCPGCHLNVVHGPRWSKKVKL